MNDLFDYSERNIQIIQRVMDELEISDCEEIPESVRALRARVTELEAALNQWQVAYGKWGVGGFGKQSYDAAYTHALALLTAKEQ